MADILYTYHDSVYVNLTNKCDCACTFCIRSHHDTVGESGNLWHEKDPELSDVIAAMDAFDFTGYQELVYCGYGEPTCALDILIESAKYAKEKYGLRIRVNTNGLANLYHGRDVVPELAEVVDVVSISLNAAFAAACAKQIPEVKFTVVDVLPEEDIEASRKLAEELGIHLRVRKYV